MHGRKSYHDLLYQHLFDFVTSEVKKRIEQSIESVNITKANQLLHAIQHDLDDDIFKDDNVDAYLLFLIRAKKLHDDPDLNLKIGVTIFQRIMALRQYEPELPVIPFDKKIMTPVRRVSFNEEGALSAIGKDYLSKLKISLQKFGIAFDEKKAAEFIFSLPLSEQSILFIAFPDFLNEIAQHNPLVNPEWFELFNAAREPNLHHKFHHLYIPAASVYEYFLHILSPHGSNKLQPGFTLIEDNNVIKMQQAGVHFLPLFSPLVKAHGLFREHHAFEMYLHGLTKAFMTCLLPHQERKIIDQHVFPNLDNFKTLACERGDFSFAQCITLMMKYYYQFKLESLFDLDHSLKRVMKHLILCLMRSAEDLKLDQKTVFNNFLSIFIFSYFNLGRKEDEKFMWLKLFSALMTYSCAEEGVKFRLIKALLYLSNNNTYTPISNYLIPMSDKTGHPLSLIHVAGFDAAMQDIEINDNIALEIIKSSSIPTYLHDCTYLRNYLLSKDLSKKIPDVYPSVMFMTLFNSNFGSCFKSDYENSELYRSPEFK